MPDKDRERYYLQRLIACGLDVPQAPPSEPEPPDFYWEAEHFGIEITVFHLQPAAKDRPSQEIQSLIDRLTKEAQDVHARSGGPPLYVSIYFSELINLTKKSVPEIANKIANIVLNLKVPKFINEPELTVPIDLLPEGIIDISIHGSVNNVDRLWHAAKGGWETDISPAEVQFEIERKSRAIYLAKKQCSVLWLVIVEDPFIQGAPAKISEEAINYKYRYNYDRLIWLKPHIPRAIELIKQN